MDKLLEYDRDLLVFFNHLGSADYDNFWKFVTQIQVWIPLFLLFAFLIYKTYKNQQVYKKLLFTVLVSFTTWIVTELIKTVVRRPRPIWNESLSDSLRVLIEPTSFSFFSGHASSSFALTTFVVLIIRKKYKWASLFYIWPLLFSFSRMYFGVHYPSDILAGAFVGVLIAVLYYKIVKLK
ncbi:phosphatase PAP2 family protein [Galbibacter sp. EGI 63066]|uniref:phosphatase PAP2 family protein n=1 Tax=Galbibacter sp. EGI 63066 TaxID=2993559 RepID=UPI0022495D0E|nr:phosphatase PAP2 family protein [Galbibacter sp. EGI 63066]MCX2680405.1 phosphatase PAP2 family protein [Galbibacter sp. EGI 63066]